MRIDILTLFPEMCDFVLDTSITGRAKKAGHVEIYTHNIRDYSDNKHKKTDDYPYGGGRGMIMTPEPIYKCFMSVCEQVKSKPHLIYMSPKGKTLVQQTAKNITKQKHIAILCGHYEGIDQRVLDLLIDEEISIGDYVLTGGELPALVLCDAVIRLCDGVLDEECTENESHNNGMIEHEQYTRPAIWHDIPVPDVLLSGHEANIIKYRKERSEELTKLRNNNEI